MGQKQRAEFRQEVVRVALTSGLSRKQVASDFGIGFSTLSRWLKEGRSNITPSEPRIDLIQENERLRKENRLLYEESGNTKKGDRALTDRGMRSNPREVTSRSKNHDGVARQMVAQQTLSGFKLIEEHQNKLPIQRLYQVMNVSARGYRAYRTHPISRSQ